MIVLGCDPGSTNVGMSVMDNQKLLFCARSNFTSDSTEFQEKLDLVQEDISLEFVRLIHHYKVTHVAYEIVPAIRGFSHHDFVVSTSQSLRTLAVQYNLIRQGIASNTVKKIVTGNARAEKIVVRDAVLELYPDLLTDFDLRKTAWDAFDSVAVNLAAQSKGKWRHPKTSALTGRTW